MKTNTVLGVIGLTILIATVSFIGYRIAVNGDPVSAPVGVTQGDPDEYEVPADVQAFYNECKTKGGVIQGSGGVKADLPTTEEGYTCWYQNRDCWDFLTYSRERYMGGNPGCPTQGLQPQQQINVPDQPPATPGQAQGGAQPQAQSAAQIIPPADNLIGTWTGSGNINFTGSVYCTNYTINWSADVKKISDTQIQGEMFDINRESVGSLEANWDNASQSWELVIASDILVVSNLSIDENQIKGNVTIKPAWIPCDDVTGQSGSFNGKK